jgi:hypothetical protein
VAGVTVLTHSFDRCTYGGFMPRQAHTSAATGVEFTFFTNSIFFDGRKVFGPNLSHNYTWTKHFCPKITGVNVSKREMDKVTFLHPKNPGKFGKKLKYTLCLPTPPRKKIFPPGVL